MTRPVVARVAMLAVFATWEEQIERGELRIDGLLRIRTRLLLTNEFAEADPVDRDRMVALVTDAIASALGVPAEDLPGSIFAAPDSPEGLEGGSGREW